MHTMEKLINSRIGLNLVSFVARTTPPWLGYRIARLAAGWLSTRRDSTLVKAVRSNQWVVAGEPNSKDSLDRSVRSTIQNSAFAIYELYHYLDNPKKGRQLFIVDPPLMELMNRPEQDQRGVVLVGVHLGCFDLVLQLACMTMKRFKPLVLTIPNPEGGRQMEFEIRKRTGMNLQLATPAVFRQAIRHLQGGGIVVTGIDRPIPEPELRPRFFGRPASLPVHHIFLASKAQVPVVLAVSRMEEDGKYHVISSPPIEMDPYPDRTQGLLQNAEKVLAVAENFICQTPQQWTMSHPVWPETVNQAPS